MSPSRNPWPDETPEQVIERTRREHGDAVAKVVAKALGAEPPSRRKQQPTKVGRKPKYPSGFTRRGVPSEIGPGAIEIREVHRFEPISLRRLLTVRRMTTCHGCQTRVASGDEMGRLSNGRLVCTSCIPTLAPGRHLP